MTEKANFDVGIKILQDLTPSTKKHLKPFFNSYQYFWSFNYFKDCNNLIPFLILITLRRQTLENKKSNYLSQEMICGCLYVQNQ